ncbi:hypothetical protein BFJ63_vAg19339, partial [Fusarium oxysporum f. sp. narcissi]
DVVQVRRPEVGCFRAKHALHARGLQARQVELVQREGREELGLAGQARLVELPREGSARGTRVEGEQSIGAGRPHLAQLRGKVELRIVAPPGHVRTDHLARVHAPHGLEEVLARGVVRGHEVQLLGAAQVHELAHRHRQHVVLRVHRDEVLVAQLARDVRRAGIDADHDLAGIDDRLARGQQHVAPDVTAQHVDAVLLDQLLRLLAPQLGLEPVVLVDDLDLAPTHAAADVLDPQVDRIDHVPADDRAAAGQRRHDPDLDRRRLRAGRSGHGGSQRQKNAQYLHFIVSFDGTSKADGDGDGPAPRRGSHGHEPRDPFQVGLDVLGGPRPFDAAALHDVEAVRQMHELLEVLVDDEDRQARAAQIGQAPPDLLPDQGRQPFGGFVQDEQAGIRHQRASDGQHLLLTARQQVSGGKAALVQLREDLVDAIHSPWRGPRGPAGRRRHEVLVQGQVGKDVPSLGHEAHAQPRDLVGRQAGDVDALERDVPALLRKQPQDAVHRGRLSHAVAAHEAHHLALSDGQVHVEEHAIIPQVGVANIRVGADLRGRAGGQHRAAHQDRDPVSQPEDRIHVVLHQDDGGLAFQAGQVLGHLQSFLVPQPGHGLVEQHDRGVAGHGQRELEQALLAMTQALDQRPCPAVHAHAAQQFMRARLQRGVALDRAPEAEGVPVLGQDRQHGVLQHGHAPGQRR